MEYTKDLVFSIQYDEVNKVANFAKKTRTSKWKAAVKRHKLVTACIAIAFALMILDSILMLNFVVLLEQI